MNLQREIAVVLILLSPFAALADPIVESAPCENNVELICATGIIGLELSSGTFDVDFIVDSYNAVYDVTSPLFFGDITGATLARNAIVQLLNSRYAGPIGDGMFSADAVLVPYVFLGGDTVTSACLTNDPESFVWTGSSCIAGKTEVFNDSNFWAYTRFTAVKEVPEPSTLALFGIGLVGIGLIRRRPKRSVMVILTSIVMASTNATAGIIQVDFSDLSPFTDLREFGDGGDYGDSIVRFGERFVGQTTTLGGPVSIRPNEILSGVPISPLELEVTGPKEGVCTNFNGQERDRGIAGLISDGQGTQLSCGEGSVAFLFEENQSQIGIRIGDGPITFQFFDRLGGSLGVFEFNVAIGTELGFVDLSSSIGGFSFHNLDIAGTTLGALYFGGDARPVPNPGTLALFAIGLVGMGLARRRKKA